MKVCIVGAGAGGRSDALGAGCGIKNATLSKEVVSYSGKIKYEIALRPSKATIIKEDSKDETIE